LASWTPRTCAALTRFTTFATRLDRLASLYLTGEKWLLLPVPAVNPSDEASNAYWLNLATNMTGILDFLDDFLCPGTKPINFSAFPP
jgi:hypothetical protein